MTPPKAYKPEEFPIFAFPDTFSNGISNFNTPEIWMNKLKGYLHNVIGTIGIKNKSELKFNQSVLYEIYTRVEKRRVYFHIYHNGMEMGEINEGALICFWILKLMPFRHEYISNSLLNTKMAYTVFVNLLKYVASKTKRRVNVKAMLMNNLLYTFQYRDLSKEAIMALVESHLY